jgi:hypothetical protein
MLNRGMTMACIAQVKWAMTMASIVPVKSAMIVACMPQANRGMIAACTSAVSLAMTNAPTEEPNAKKQKGLEIQFSDPFFLTPNPLLAPALVHM